MAAAGHHIPLLLDLFMCSALGCFCCCVGYTGPQLSQQLVYLLHLFSLYTSGSHGSSRGSGHTAQIQQLLSTPEATLVDGLLLPDRDEGPLPPDVSGQGYAERDVQVRHCRLKTGTAVMSENEPY